MSYKKFLVSVAIFFISLSQGYATTKTYCSPETEKEIEVSIKDFLDKNNTIAYKDIVVLSKKCFQNYARATLHPKKPVTDDATIYFKKIKGQWQVLKYGTDFNPGFLATIPAPLK